MMAGNPNWWSMIPPSSIFPSQYVLGSSNTLHQLSSFLDHKSLEPPQSWSQLLLGGLSGEDQDSFGSSSHFTPKRLENWEDHHQRVLIPQYPRVNPVIDCNIIKQEVSSQNNSSLRGGDDGEHEEFQASYNNRPSWSPVQINMPVSSPWSCVTSLSSNNILDFSYDRKNQPADHSSECNSPPVGGICKKARVQPSSSQPPLKVRKEKLGDRITALHQIVSPFGKTDTASVLLEAIGYIRFLESQIEVMSLPAIDSNSIRITTEKHALKAALSTPYLGNAAKNLRNAPHTVQGERNCMFPEDPGQLSNDNCSSLKRKWAPNQDSHQEYKAKGLRSKGLCLVPVSCTQNVGADINIGADYWAPARLWE